MILGACHLTLPGSGPNIRYEQEFLLDFVPGIAIPLRMSASGGGYGISYRPDQTNYGYGGAEIQSMRVIDANGAEVHGYRYRSATGLAYDQFVRGAQVPEPGTFALMGFGAMSLVVWRRR